MFNEKELLELLELLSRTTIQGKEAIGFMELVQKINNELKNLRGGA